MTDTTNPAEVIDDEVMGVEADQDGFDDQADESADLDADGEQSEEEEGSQEEEEFEEIERGDKKYRIPKALKDDLLRQEDYTRKTQALAETRKTLEAKLSSFEGTAKEIDDAAFELKGLDNRLNDLSALTPQDWAYIRQLDAQNGTNEYDRLNRELVTLPRQREAKLAELKTKEQQVLQAKQEALASRWEEGQAILSRDIPGWGQDTAAKLTSFVQSEYGLNEKDHGHLFTDPALIKMAHAAMQLKETQRKTQTQAKAAQIAKVTPAPQVKTAAAPKSGLSDKMSTEDWVAQRERQERQARQRRAG